MGGGGTFGDMARIALNGRLLVPGKMEGIGRFTLNTLKHLIKLRPEDNFLLVVDRADNALFHLGPNVEVVRIRIPARRPWLMKLWFGRPLSRVLKRWKADVFVSLEGPLAMNMPHDFPQLTVIHDLNFEHRPDGLPFFWRRYYQTEFPRFAQLAHVLGTVSDYSRQDLARTYDLDPAQIEVFPNAADVSFKPATSRQRDDARKSLSQGRPYFIFIGSIHPRKNLEGLISAFHAYREMGGTWDLVVVGVPMWKNNLSSMSSNVVAHVHYAGRLNDDALIHALAGAQGLVFVPWFEGFGIPVVEAMASGVPVISSNVTSLPEVCGDAAFAMVAPAHIESIAREMQRLEQHPELAEAASLRGLARAKDFSWASTGEKLSRVIAQMMETQ